MRRREYLRITGAGMLGLSGCVGLLAQEPTPSPSPTATPSPTPTLTPTPTPDPTSAATPEPRRPRITESSLLYKWDELWDVLDRQVDAVGRGADAIIGFRHETEIHDGTYDVTEQVHIYGPDGNRIDQQRFDIEQLTDSDGVHTREHALFFDTLLWDLGEYTYEVLVRDNVTGKTSESAEGEFQVNTPLGSEEGVLISVDAPDTVSVGQYYSFTLELGNRSHQDGSIVSHLSTKYATSDTWTTSEEPTIIINIPSNDLNTWESGIFSWNNTGAVQFRLDALGEIWEVEITTN